MTTLTLPQAFDLAVQHHQAGRLSDAEALYRQILAVQPGHADALHLLGVVAHQAGRHEAAVELIRQSINLSPNNPAAHSNLGEAYRALGRLDEAVASYGLALRLQPENAGAQYNLGNALKDLGRFDEAVAAYRRVTQLQPGFPDAYNNLGNLLRNRGEVGDAIAAYEQALRIQPDCAPALNNLGNALLDGGRFDEAVAAYRRALHLQPDCAEAHTNLGVALVAQGDIDGAVEAHRRAIEFQPGYAMAHGNLGNALRDRGQLHEAVAAYRRALELQPADSLLHSNLLYALHFLPEQNERMIVEEQEHWNRQIGEPLKRFILPQTNERNPERRLRIGYMSPDFRYHVVGRNLAPLFRHHDRANFEIVCYSGVLQPDALTGEIRRHTDHWRHTVSLSDEALAEMIRQDGVDILVDLTQHLAHNRLPVFARQPAPVQVSFAGYPESTGLEAIEYRISDRWLESERGAEQVFLLDSFWCYEPAETDLEVNDLPASGNGWVTLGSLNQFSKVNDAALKLWARVLMELADSRLVLLTPSGSHRQRVLEILAHAGVEERRVEFVTPRPRREYLELYQRLDMVLDPFPYGGHTTSLDALWMGVPVVSLAGDRPVSRAGLSQMSNLGLEELVSFSEEDYVAIAVRLARDLPRLAEMRRTLRPRMEASVLMDAPRFARNIEDAYRAMWRRWCGTRPEK